MSLINTIQQSKSVTDGINSFPLRGGISPLEGAYLQDLIGANRPRRSLEIGMAYGISALYICEAMEGLGREFTHTAIDPMQRELWHDIGLRNLSVAGFDDNVRFYRGGSEIVLPQLVRDGESYDFIFIDGFHTFDHVMVDVFYATRLLADGGLLVLDDANWPSINKLVNYVAQFPCYESIGGPEGGGLLGRIARTKPRDLPKAILHRLRKHGVGGTSVAKASVAAFRKNGADERPSDWYVGF